MVRDRRGTGERLARALRARGEVCVELEIDDVQPAELAGVFTGACRGVVHCGSLDAAPWEDTTPATLTADLRRGTLATVVLAQAILRRAFRDPPRLFLVTRGSQAVGKGPVSAAQAPLWGLGRTIALEHPELECTLIDLPALPARAAEPLADEPLVDEVAQLVREFVAGDGEAQIALRAEGRFVARLVQSSFDVPAAPAPRSAGMEVPARIVADGSYLITGGLGGLGLVLARWMVVQGARHLVLVGRSAPGDAARAAVRAMEDMGADVRVIAGDVARPADVARILGEIEGGLPPLRGVVHAAVVVADRTLLELQEEHLLTTMGPKILGAWNLSAATRGHALDFFVMYSSMASVLGVPGMAAYAAGNAFLDALAHARAAEGLPATSIQWGLFAELGVAAADGRGLRLSARGIESFTPAEGTELFGRVLERPRAAVGLFRLSLRRWLEATPQAAGMRYLSELSSEIARPEAPEVQKLRDALANLPAAGRLALLESHVVEQLGRVLRIAPARIDRRAPFKNLGLDSLMGLEVRNRLERTLGLRLQATLFFTCPAVGSLVEHLLACLALPPEDPPDEPRPAAVQEVAAPDGIDGDDLLAAFDASMRRLDEGALL